jgi:hypothetical protein
MCTKLFVEHHNSLLIDILSISNNQLIDEYEPIGYIVRLSSYEFILTIDHADSSIESIRIDMRLAFNRQDYQQEVKRTNQYRW